MPESSLIAGPDHVELTMDMVRWSGTVRDARSGEALDSVWVQAYSEDFRAGGAHGITGSHGEFTLLVPKGKTFKLSLYDYAKPRMAVPVDMKPEEVDRMYARVYRRLIEEIPAVRDSTFDLSMMPIKR
jgi:hypothetical protein